MRIAVIGLGYVGLPVAVSLAKKFPRTIGFDIKQARIDELKKFQDSTGEVSAAELKEAKLTVTDQISEISGADFYIVAVPTPIDENRNPDLTPLMHASTTVGKAIKSGAIVVFESTVYPGVTEEYCGPIIEQVSELKCGVDFKLGYSPERINPGDKEHTFERIVKVVSGQDTDSLDKIAALYESVVTAGVFRASSIRVAEAAKVIENTQRDLNIALMNELSIIFDRMGIRTKDVLEAAGTKWNFIRFFPGLVGGHCIGVDPYYLTTAAERLGYHPQVILAGRKINDNMGKYVAQQAIKMLVKRDINPTQSKIGVLGLTFKEDVPDIRNSRVPDIINELKEFGCTPFVADPLADPEEVYHEYGLKLTPINEVPCLDCLILAVPHGEFLTSGDRFLDSYLTDNGILIDVKSAINPNRVKTSQALWSL